MIHKPKQLKVGNLKFAYTIALESVMTLYRRLRYGKARNRADINRELHVDIPDDIIGEFLNNRLTFKSSVDKFGFHCKMHADVYTKRLLTVNPSVTFASSTDSEKCNVIMSGYTGPYFGVVCTGTGLDCRVMLNFRQRVILKLHLDTMKPDNYFFGDASRSSSSSSSQEDDEQ